MRRRHWIMLTKREDDRMRVLYQPMTWNEARVYLRAGWALYEKETDKP